jgi:hypothetical protein
MPKKGTYRAFGKAVAAAAALMFTSCCCGHNDPVGASCGACTCACGNAVAAYTMYGAPIKSELNVYSYALKNYSDYDVGISINGDTGVIAKRMVSYNHDTVFRASSNHITVTYSPANKVKVEPDGTAFVRFFNK